jgi:hypothetical protein
MCQPKTLLNLPLVNNQIPVPGEFDVPILAAKSQMWTPGNQDGAKNAKSGDPRNSRAEISKFRKNIAPRWPPEPSASEMWLPA